jgi:hypothetical protein
MKRYFQNWKKIYKFQEYGDTTNFFIELAYATTKREFKSNLGAPLINKTAMNGLPIFKNENIDFAKYKLLEERIEEQDANLIFVYETYGYAPTESYIEYSAEPALFFGKDDNTQLLTSTIRAITEYNYTYLGLYNIDNISEFKVGNKVVIRRPFGQVGASQQYALVSPEMVIIAVVSRSGADAPTDADDTMLVVEPFLFQRASDGATIDETPGIIVATSYSPCTITRSSVSNVPMTKITSVRNVITFWETFPQPNEQFVVSTGTGTTDTITSATIPSITQWKEMVVNGEYINIQDSVVSVVYPKTFFKKTLKQIKAQ